MDIKARETGALPAKILEITGGQIHNQISGRFEVSKWEEHSPRGRNTQEGKIFQLTGVLQVTEVGTYSGKIDV